MRFDGATGTAFERVVLAAFAEAAKRLAEDPCLRVLAEFRDRLGETLERRLERLGLTAGEYLGQLVVSDGDNRAFCRSSLVLAGTRPGATAVLVCGRRFTRLQVRDPAFAAAIVIHEALHTLGLPENPPSSEAITAQVVARCGR